MTLIYFPFTSPFTVNYWMYCSSQLFWFLSSTWWEGKWDAGNGIMPYSPQVTHTRRNMKLTMVSILVKGPNPQDTAGSPFWTTCQPQLLCPWWLQVSLLSSAVPKQILSQHLHRFNRNSDCFFQGFAVIFTLTDPVHQSLWAAYHVFGLLSCGQGLCTTILTLTAAACVRKKKSNISQFNPSKKTPAAYQWFLCTVCSQAKTTPELYYMSLVLTVVSAISTGERQLSLSLAHWIIHSFIKSSFRRTNTCFCPFRFFHGQRRTVANQQALCDRSKQKQWVIKHSSCPTMICDTTHVKNSWGLLATSSL